VNSVRIWKKSRVRQKYTSQIDQIKVHVLLR